MPYQIEIREKTFTSSHREKLQFPPHIHPHLELIYLRSGSSMVFVDNKRYSFKAGELLLLFPNQIHSYVDESSIDADMLIFAPDLFSELKEILCTKTSISPIHHPDQLPTDIAERFAKIHQQLNSKDLFNQLSAKGQLLSLLCELLSCMELMDAPAEQDCIKRLLTYCIEHYTEPLSLELLSKDLHLNKYYISHIFRERMNISYKDFINQLRVEHACELLRKDIQITEVAYASGFSTIRTFNRAFLKHMGITPREYTRKLIRKIE